MYILLFKIYILDYKELVNDCFQFLFAKDFFSLLNTDGSFRQSRPNLTSLLVQPISASFAKKLIALPKLRMNNDTCSPLELPYNGKVTCASLHLLNTLRTMIIFIPLKLKGLWFFISKLQTFGRRGICLILCFSRDEVERYL